MVSTETLAEKFTSDMQTGEVPFEGNPHVYHCDYANVYWQKYFERAAAVDGKSILSDAIRDQIAKSLHPLFEDLELGSNESRAEAAESFFADITGLGKVSLPAEFEDGTTIVVENSHIGKGWLKIFGEQDEPKCTDWEGVLEAAAGAVTGLEGPDKESFDVKEVKCIAQGDENCEFEVHRE